MNINEALTQVTQIAVLLAVLKYFNVYSLIRNLHNITKYNAVGDGYDEEIEGYFTGKSDPTAVESETFANYLPGDDDLFDPSNFNMSDGSYQVNDFDGFESRLYNVDTGVEEND